MAVSEPNSSRPRRSVPWRRAGIAIGSVIIAGLVVRALRPSSSPSAEPVPVKSRSRRQTHRRRPAPRDRQIVKPMPSAIVVSTPALQRPSQVSARKHPSWPGVAGLALAITVLAVIAAIGIAYELCPPLTGTRASGALYAPLSDLWAMSVDEWGRPISILVRIENFRGLLETFGIGHQWQHRALFVAAAGIGVFLIGVATLRFIGSRLGLLRATLAFVICVLIPAAIGALVGFQVITRDIVSDRATLENLRENHCAFGERCGEWPAS